MDRDGYWSIVDSQRAAVGSDDECFLEALGAVLLTLPREELISFDSIQEELFAEAYHRSLWAAAYIINGGCSDDGFAYFRAWLVAQGRRVFERALEDPTTLEEAIVLDSGWDAELEEFMNVPHAAFLEQFGEEMPDRPHTQAVLIGPEWDEDSVDELFPALAAKAEVRFSRG
ncbi:MAG TPA: DUF4240 domain-containing protein [Polyangiaceae bacterium]|nr:DUF4240 domain-containing protein [Polyangiaceae bacterium]